MPEQEEKAAREEAETRLASARQQAAKPDVNPLSGIHTMGATGVCRAVEADLLLARDGLEQLCQAVQGADIQ